MAAVSPSSSLVTQSALSTAATHTCRFRQDTEPSWSVGSELTVDHEVPPSRVPASATEVPAPATQQRWTLAHATELNQLVVSNRCRWPQVVSPDGGLRQARGRLVPAVSAARHGRTCR